MNTRQRETSREIRLWITTIVRPIVMVGMTALACDPALRAKVRNYSKAKVAWVKRKFKKGEVE